MLTRANIIEALRKEEVKLKTDFGVKKIALFGSFAKNRHTRSSDIDILVEFDTPDFDRFICLSSYLERLFKRKVDILTPEGIRSVRVKRAAQNIKRSLVYV